MERNPEARSNGDGEQRAHGVARVHDGPLADHLHHRVPTVERTDEHEAIAREQLGAGDEHEKQAQAKC